MKNGKICILLLHSYLQMEYWLKKSYFDAVEAYPAGETKESRRQKLASTINSYLSIAPPARLLTLLQQALAYEKEKGILLDGERLDIFHNTLESSTLEDAIPTVKVVLKCSLYMIGCVYSIPAEHIPRDCVRVSEWPICSDGKSGWLD